MLRGQQGYRGIGAHKGVGPLGAIRGVRVSEVHWGLAGSVGAQGPAGV